MLHSKLVKTAFSIACVRHKNQMYNDLPFLCHLWDVAKVAEHFEFGKRNSPFFDEDICAAVWLHDVMEDTNMSYHEIVESMNKNVAELVYLVSDDKGRNRNERKQKMYPELAINENAIIIKLCDRIANIQYTIDTSDSGKWNMYVKEHDMFIKHLFNPKFTKCSKLWSKLDRLMNKNFTKNT